MRALGLAEPSDFTSGLILLGLTMLKRQTRHAVIDQCYLYATMGRACFTSTWKRALSSMSSGEPTPPSARARARSRLPANSGSRRRLKHPSGDRRESEARTGRGTNTTRGNRCVTQMTVPGSSGHRALWVGPVPRRFLAAMDGSRVRQRTMPSAYQRKPSPCLATWPMPGQAK